MQNQALRLNQALRPDRESGSFDGESGGQKSARPPPAVCIDPERGEIGMSWAGTVSVAPRSVEHQGSLTGQSLSGHDGRGPINQLRWWGRSIGPPDVENRVGSERID
jgi:hypothetical protein